MSKFIIRRLAFAIVIIILGSLCVYAVIRALPTSYVETVARQNATLPGAKSYEEILATLNARYNLDTDIFTGFGYWLKDAIKGDFGDSWLFTKPVTEKFADVIWYSVSLNVVTFILQVVIAIPLGITAATKQYSGTDYTISVFALLGISLPTFFLATLLKYVFAIKLNWFELYGIVSRDFPRLSTWGKIWDMTQHLVLPTVTLTMLSIGGLMRFTRTNMLEVLNADYIRTARAKGLPEKEVINKHAYKNTLIPLVTYLSYLLPSMFTGALITETMYQIPGIGYVSYQSMIRGDIPFTMFYSVFSIALTQLSLFLADITYAIVDPRVRIN